MVYIMLSVKIVYMYRALSFNRYHQNSTTSEERSLIVILEYCHLNPAVLNTFMHELNMSNNDLPGLLHQWQASPSLTIRYVFL